MNTKRLQIISGTDMFAKTKFAAEVGLLYNLYRFHLHTTLLGYNCLITVIVLSVYNLFAEQL